MEILLKNNNIVNIVEMKNVNNFKINRALLIVDEINSKLSSVINFYIENKIKSFFIYCKTNLVEDKIDELIEDFYLKFNDENYLDISTIKEDNIEDAIFIFLQDINNYGEFDIHDTINFIIYDENIINKDDIYLKVKAYI